MFSVLRGMMNAGCGQSGRKNLHPLAWEEPGPEGPSLRRGVAAQGESGGNRRQDCQSRLPCLINS